MQLKKALLSIALLFLFLAPVQAQLTQFLTQAELTALDAIYPADIQNMIWKPMVTNDWVQSGPVGTVMSLPGTDGFGGSPWMLGSPLATSSSNTFDYYKPPTANWRIGYFNYSENEVPQLGSFLASLPPNYPTIDRVVVWIGSGDNRGIASLSPTDDIGTFSHEGTLFVCFDMRTVSLASEVPGSPGPRIIRRGLKFIYNSLNLPDNTPAYVAGFSAGGGATLHATFKLDSTFDGAVAMSPITLPWDIFQNPNFLSPPTTSNTWARIFALDTADPAFYGSYYSGVVSLAKYIFGSEEAWRRANPLNQLVNRDPLHMPLLIITGADDELGAAGVTQTFGFVAEWQKGAYPILYRPSDQSAGRTLNFTLLAQTLKSNHGSLSTLFLQEAGHSPVTSWGPDMRALMIDFFLALEAN